MQPRILARAASAAWLGLFSTACGLDAAFPSLREEVVETRSLEPGGQFSLENVNGQVSIATWNEPRVRIEAEKGASSASVLRALRVEIEGEGSRVAVRTRHPKGSWLFGGGGRVRYRVKVPAEARVRVENVNGGVEIDGVGGEVRVSTTNGSVRVTEAASVVQASCVNGSVSTGYRTYPPEGRSRISTTNGSVTVSLPEGAGGRVEAETVNGSVDNELGLASTERASRRRLEGRLGSGDGKLEVSTVNGSIRLRRR